MHLIKECLYSFSKLNTNAWRKVPSGFSAAPVTCSTRTWARATLSLHHQPAGLPGICTLKTLAATRETMDLFILTSTILMKASWHRSPGKLLGWSQAFLLALMTFRSIAQKRKKLFLFF